MEWHANMAEGRWWSVEEEVFEGNEHWRHGKGRGKIGIRPYIRQIILVPLQ